MEPLLLNSFDKISDCLCEFCIGSLLAFCPPALCFSSIWLASSSTTACQTKTIFCTKRKYPKNLWYFLAFVPRRAFVFPQSDLALAEPLPYQDQTSAMQYFYQKENIPWKLVRFFRIKPLFLLNLLWQWLNLWHSKWPTQEVSPVLLFLLNMPCLQINRYQTFTIQTTFSMRSSHVLY